ncbi:uncharacterized protein [Misgurnus anguillicaudatus]|uniref:uncharacterized protein isoform X2 n=1 Tax=Misgurnus anguillicaudatus TaxID=75329 RepID=UPI003CCF62F5
MRRRDFTSASVSKNAVVCSVHFRPDDYNDSDMMEFNMGYRSKNLVRLRVGAVPSVHAARPSSPPGPSSSARGDGAGGKKDGNGSVRGAAEGKRTLCTAQPKMVSVGTQTKTSAPSTSPVHSDDDSSSLFMDEADDVLWTPEGEKTSDSSEEETLQETPPDHIAADKFIVCRSQLMSLYNLPSLLWKNARKC